MVSCSGFYLRILRTAGKRFLPKTTDNGPLTTDHPQLTYQKKETFRRGEEGFFGVSGPVIFGARAQNGKVTRKLTSSMPDGYFHASGDRSKDELLLLGGLLSRLLCGFLSGFFGCHGTSPPFLFHKCKGVEK